MRTRTTPVSSDSATVPPVLAFDFTKMTVSTTGYTHGFVISASWLYFKGLEICNVPMNMFSNNGVAVTSGGNDIFELLNMHHNSGNGIFIGSKSAGGHLVLNCDAHDNYDATSSQGQLKEVQPLTGYIRGGVTAIGGKKDYPVFVDETIELFDVVAVSAGVRGTQILIAPADYPRAVGAAVGAIVTFT